VTVSNTALKQTAAARPLLSEALAKTGKIHLVCLPNADRAVVEPGKVRDYILSDVRPVGRFKALFFKALGFRAEQWESLRDAFLAIAQSEAAVPTQVTEFGQKFEVRGNLRGQHLRRATVVTVWIVRSGEDFPRFVSA
jgi:hypothetical protein